MDPLLSADWVALGGIAQFAAAAATIGLAGVTTYMAIKTRQVAAATKDESAATVSLAQEAQRDRELAWRPQLSLVAFKAATYDKGERIQVEVKNAGGGPAIDCKVVVRRQEHWWLIRLGDIQVNSSGASDGGEQPTACPDEVFHYVSHGLIVVAAKQRDMMILCSDVLGRRFRFPVENVFDRPESWRFLRPEVSPESSRPMWAIQPALWW